MSLLAILSAIPWGTFLGGVLAWFQRREERKDRAQAHAQNVELMRLQQAGAINAAEWSGFTASHDSAGKEDGAGVWRWVRSLRYGARTFLTLFLVFAAVVLAWRAGDLGGLAERVVFFAEMALGWHFGWKVSGARK